MKNYFNFRNRALQTLILGLIVLTFYACYRTTINENRPFVAAARSANRSLTLQVQSPSSSSSNNNNSAAEGASFLVFVLSNGNSSVENSLLPNGNSQRNKNNNPTSIVTGVSPSTLTGWHSSSSSSSLIGPTNLQMSSSSSNIESSNKNYTLQLSSSNNNNNNNNNNSNPTSSSSLYGDTARAIYHFGHDVSVSEKCPDNGHEMDLVIMIMSAPSHVEARTAIRQTWGHYGQRRDVGILFMLGSTRPEDKKIEKLLSQEERLYGDVIRGRFIDSYYNLTLKTISSLEWINKYCNETKFILKTDDDMFINVPRVLSFVRKHERNKNVIFGRLAKRWKPIRNKKSKYYVSLSQYSPAVFPDFTTGPAYLLSRDIINKLYLAALEQTYLKLEDVFTTGIVAHKLGIKRYHVNEFLNKRIPYNPCNIQRGISIHMVKYSEQFDLWKKLLDGKSKCK